MFTNQFEIKLFYTEVVSEITFYRVQKKIHAKKCISECNYFLPKSETHLAPINMTQTLYEMHVFAWE